MKRSISTGEAPAPVGPYSQGIVSRGLLFVAGQGPLGKDGSVRRGSITEQTELTLRNIEEIAAAAGGSLAGAVRLGVFLSDLADFPEFNAVYERLVPEPRPVRTTVQCGLAGIDVEIDAVIELPTAEGDRQPCE